MRKLIFLFSIIIVSIQCNAQNKKLLSKIGEAETFAKNTYLNTSYCIMVDMSIPSGKNRMFVWDFKQKKVIISTLCAHGMGLNSTEETPVYSNKPGSNCTSLGKYRIGIQSYSNYGINIHYKLHGLEATNSNAYHRIVVLHSYYAVPNKEIYPQYLPLGYSLGCPVISDEAMTKIHALLKKEKHVLLWIYN